MYSAVCLKAVVVIAKSKNGCEVDFREFDENFEAAAVTSTQMKVSQESVILLFNEMAIIHIEILTFKFTKSRLYMGFLKWFCALRKQFLRNFVLYYLADRSQLLIVKQNFCNYEITSKSFICFWSDFVISKIQERHWYSSQESSCQCENRTQIAGMIVLSCWVMYLQI